MVCADSRPRWARVAAASKDYESATPRRCGRLGGSKGAVAQTVEDLAQREAACCPFLDYRVETIGDEVIYTITNPITGDERAGVEVVLDASYALPDNAGSNFDGFVDRLADGGINMLEVADNRFEFRDSPPA